MGPAPCPAATCPQRESVVRNRLPFSTAAPTPTDLVLPISTLADADRLTASWSRHGARPASRARRGPVRTRRATVPSSRSAVTGGRSSRTIASGSGSTDATGSRCAGMSTPRPASDAWALRFGLSDEPLARLGLGAGAPGEPRHARRRRVRDPRDELVAGSGARAVELGEVRRATGFEPVAPGMVGGSTATGWCCHETTPAGHSSRTRTASRSSTSARHARGTATRRSTRRRAGGGDLAHRWRVAYYEPASRTTAVASRSTRPEPTCTSSPTCRVRSCWRPPPRSRSRAFPMLRRVDASAGRRGDRRTRLVETARASVPFPIELPTALPAGFGLASVELLDGGFGAGVTLYLRDKDADAGIGTIRLHLEAASALPPATSAAQSTVEAGGVRGRFTPDRSQLEWIDGVVSPARRSGARARGVSWRSRSRSAGNEMAR